MSDVRIDTAEGRLALNGGIDVIAETIRVDAQGRLDTDLARAGRLIGNMGDSRRRIGRCGRDGERASRRPHRTRGRLRA